MTPPEAAAAVVFFGGAFLTLRPLVSALASRIGRPPASAVTDGAVDDLRGEVEDAHRRIALLEERVDFAERMLAKQREPDRLAPPQRN